MRAIHFAIPALLALFSSAQAQSVRDLSVDDDATVMDYARDAPPVIEYHETLTPGSIIPDGVPLKLMPDNAAPNLRGFAYFVSVDHKVVVVEADTRRVVRILGGR